MVPLQRGHSTEELRLPPRTIGQAIAADIDLSPLFNATVSILSEGSGSTEAWREFLLHYGVKVDVFRDIQQWYDSAAHSNLLLLNSYETLLSNLLGEKQDPSSHDAMLALHKVLIEKIAAKCKLLMVFVTEPLRRSASSKAKALALANIRSLAEHSSSTVRITREKNINIGPGDPYAAVQEYVIEAEISPSGGEHGYVFHAAELIKPVKWSSFLRMISEQLARTQRSVVVATPSPRKRISPLFAASASAASPAAPSTSPPPVLRPFTASPKAIKPISHQSPLRILLTEDNLINQRVMVMILQKLGYCTDMVAINGEQCLSIMHDSHSRGLPVECILMDVAMPVMDGIECSRQIRQSKENSRPWIIALTANSDQNTRECCSSAGMDDFLSKPATVEALTKALQNAYRQLHPG
jgi:CheY-like chemotaxis protein